MLKFILLTFVLAGATWATAAPSVSANTYQEQTVNALSDRETSLARIGAYTAQGNMDSLKTSVHQALNQGLTVNEIRDAMVQLYAYAGFPRSLNALGVLTEAVKERQARGEKTEIGRTAKLPPNYDALKNGTQTQTDLVGQAVDVSALSPDIDKYLKTHLFGDIFASDLLTWQEREIVTVAALAQIQGAQSQLASHESISRHNGVSTAQIQAAKTITAPQLSVFATGKPNDAYAQYFDGKSYLNMLSTEQVVVGNVTFEPKTRNHWHTHHATKGGGQILIVTAGRGYYQAWGEPARELHAGDVVNIPANTKHWHGAAKDSWFQHLAIEVAGENTRTEWHEPVADDDYNQLK